MVLILSTSLMVSGKMKVGSGSLCYCIGALFRFSSIVCSPGLLTKRLDRPGHYDILEHREHETQRESIFAPSLYTM